MRINIRRYHADDPWKSQTWDDDITGFTDNLVGSNSQTLGYDNLNRLNTGSGAYGSLSYGYDANGNRNTETLNGTNTTFTIASSSNQLVSLSGGININYSYDANGNLTGDGTNTYTYDNTNRLASVVTSSGTDTYQYNALGQRVEKTVGSTTTVYVYDEAGHLIGEYTPSGTLIAEHIWLNDRPIGVKTSTGLYYVHTDQLNTPRYITNSSKTVVWQWSSDPFGNTTPTGSLTYNLRFPGQYYDAETGHNYNYFRDYDPTTGRYIESDPIGLAGGSPSTYAYAGGNPFSNFDPLGLFCTSSGGYTLCAYPGGPAFMLPTPQGFPAYFGPSNFILYHKYEVSVPIGCDTPSEALEGLINHPTPGNPQPATVSGTPNNAPALIFPNNPVTSYLTTDLVTGAPLVVNITGAGSAFGPGYVAREVSNGAVNTYGEGLNPLQSPAFVGYLIRYFSEHHVWGTQTKSFLSECGCSH